MNPLDLPAVLDNLMRYFSFNELRTCVLVCKEWRNSVLAKKTYWTGGIVHVVDAWSRRKYGSETRCHPDWDLSWMTLNQVRDFAWRLKRLEWNDDFYHFEHPLFIAIQLGDLPLLTAVYEHVGNKKPKTVDQKTLLHVTAEDYQSPDLIDYVMSKMTVDDYNQKCYGMGMTPLHTAVQARNLMMTEKITGVMRNLYLKNDDRLTPLDLLLERRREHILFHTTNVYRWDFQYPPNACCEHEVDLQLIKLIVSRQEAPNLLLVLWMSHDVDKELVKVLTTA